MSRRLPPRVPSEPHSVHQGPVSWPLWLLVAAAALVWVAGLIIGREGIRVYIERMCGL